MGLASNGFKAAGPSPTGSTCVEVGAMVTGFCSNGFKAAGPSPTGSTCVEVGAMVTGLGLNGLMLLLMVTELPLISMHKSNAVFSAPFEANFTLYLYPLPIAW